MRIKQTESNGMTTDVRVGRVSYSVNEYKNLKLDRDNWKQIASDLVEANYEQDARQLTKAIAKFEGYNWSVNG